MLGATLGAKDYLDLVCREIGRLDRDQLVNLNDLIERAYHDGRFVFICGNGGSGANASHLCEDLAKCTLRDFEGQKRLKVLSLTDNTPWLMAVANDLHYDRIFVEQLKNLASPGDLLLAISGSGNSPNILKAVEWANANGHGDGGDHRVRRRQAQGAGEAQPARGGRRHGGRRVAAPGRLPLDHRRHVPPDLRLRSRRDEPCLPRPRDRRDEAATRPRPGRRPDRRPATPGDRPRGRAPRASSPQIEGAADGLRAEFGPFEAVGIGFGGPVDSAKGVVTKSHHVAGWDTFPLADWARYHLHCPRVSLQNDADTAALGEARFGAGVGLSPILYVTIGSGIGGGLVVDGRIYRGAGEGAVEVGHLWIDDGGEPAILEHFASGWSIGRAGRGGGRGSARDAHGRTLPGATPRR